MSLVTQVSNLATSMGTRIKAIRTEIYGSATGTLAASLQTTDKTSIVAAINEARTTGGSGTPPNASESVAGVVELATNAEVTTGTDDARAVTPLKLKTRLDAGFQPVDTDLTAIAGLTTQTYGRSLLTLADVAALRAQVGTASETAQGIVELATLAEVATGTDAARAVTAAGVRQERLALKAEILGAAGAAYDTLEELKTYVDALDTADEGQIGAITTALASRVRTDTAAQGLDATQQSNARTNISVYSKVEIGDPETDFVAVFNTALT